MVAIVANIARPAGAKALTGACADPTPLIAPSRARCGDQRPRARTECAEEGEKKREGLWREKNRGACDDEKAHTGIPNVD